MKCSTSITIWGFLKVNTASQKNHEVFYPPILYARRPMFFGQIMFKCRKKQLYQIILREMCMQFISFNLIKSVHTLSSVLVII